MNGTSGHAMLYYYDGGQRPALISSTHYGFRDENTTDAAALGWFPGVTCTQSDRLTSAEG